MMEKKRSPKYTLFYITSCISTLIGFLAGMLIVFFLLIIFSKNLEFKANKANTPLIALFVVLPIMCLGGMIFSYVGMAVYMIIWKLFLTPQEVQVYMFKYKRHGTLDLSAELTEADKKTLTSLIKFDKEAPLRTKIFLFINPLMQPYYIHYKLVTFIFPKVKERFN